MKKDIQRAEITPNEIEKRAKVLRDYLKSIGEDEDPQPDPKPKKKNIDINTIKEKQITFKFNDEKY